VVAAGATALVPVKATLPIPWSILTMVAPETLQLRFDVSPTEILDGEALKETIDGCWPGVLKVIGPHAQPTTSSGISIPKRIRFFIVHLPKKFIKTLTITDHSSMPY
jgi:hypothetical protein